MYVYKRAQSNTAGPLGKNIVYLKLYPSVEQCQSAGLMNERIEQIRELIRLRDGIDQLEVLSMSEVEDILTFLCVS